jgi:hypothetical protein
MAESNRRTEVLSDLVAGTKKLISRLREDMDDLSTKGRYKLDVISLKNKRARVFRELGMRTYVLIKNQKHDLPEVKGLVGEINRLDKEIKTLEKAFGEYRSGVETKARAKQAEQGGAATRGSVRRKRAARKPKTGEE